MTEQGTHWPGRYPRVTLTILLGGPRLVETGNNTKNKTTTTKKCHISQAKTIETHQYFSLITKHVPVVFLLRLGLPS